MPLTVDKKWLRLKRWLRREFPPRYPVTIRRTSFREKFHGYTVFLDDDLRFVIRVRIDQSTALQIDTLIHEYAHVLAWFGLDEDVHAEEWGVAYARIYRAFIEWDFGRPRKDNGQCD